MEPSSRWSYLKARPFRRNCLILFLLALAFGLFQARTLHTQGAVLFSDLFFSECMLFFLFGMIRVLKNLRALTGASYSFRFVHKEMRSLHSGRQAGPETGDRTPEEETQEDYATYRDRQKKHADAPGYLIISALFLILSLAMLPLC